MPHRKLNAAMWELIKEGAASRRDKTVNPYQANTVQYFLHVQGWLTEDLRLALIKADHVYARSQGVR